MNWPDSLDYKILWKLALPGKIFLNAYKLNVINDFSDTFFLQDSDNISYSTWKIFFPSSSLLLLLWNFYILAICVFGVNIWWNGTFRFSKQEHQYLSWKGLLFLWSRTTIYSCTVIVPKYINERNVICWCTKDYNKYYKLL